MALIDQLIFQLSKLQDEMQRKETKWSAALTKLQEQVKFLERENQHLHEENHKIKMKNVPSKVRNRRYFVLGEPLSPQPPHCPNFSDF